MDINRQIIPKKNDHDKAIENLNKAKYYFKQLLVDLLR